MIKAKNLNRLAIPAVLALILCCVASAGPTYSFVKIAGEWAFYDDSAGLNPTLEVAQVNSRSARRSSSDSEETFNLPAIGSVISLSGDPDDRVDSLLGRSSGGGGTVNNRRRADRPGGDDVIVPDSFSGTSLARTDWQDSSGSGTVSLIDDTLPNGKTRNTPNGNAWGYWKKRNNQDDTDNGDIAPVPVPVPGSVILAAIGAGLIKLLHDRRLKR